MKNFRYLLDPVCLLAFAAYALNRFFLVPTFHGAFLQNWFNDFWMIPAALPPLLWIQRRLGLRTHDRVPTLWEISLHWALWSLICEGIGPLLVKGRHGDWMDVLVYALGAIVSTLWWYREGVLPVSRSVKGASSSL